MGSVVKNPSTPAGDVGGVALIPGLGRSHREGNGNPSGVLPGKSWGQSSHSHGLERVRHELVTKQHSNFIFLNLVLIKG